MIEGKHLIAGEWKSGPGTFMNRPVSGDPSSFSTGSPELVDEACRAARQAFPRLAALSTEQRARFLEAIAEAIDELGDDITRHGCLETGLPEVRLVGERGRTTGQLRLFASHIRTGAHLDYRHDTALPDRQPLPRPDLKLIQRPVGPVAVFGASNFPLAFSTAGGDTAAALAAGCPVVVKGHPAHPATSELVGKAISKAVEKQGMPAGVFSLIQSEGIEEGIALVQHPAIKAVGFTGSLRAGRALFGLCAGRAEPIPFFGELGSVNPNFVLPHAQENRAAEIAVGWIASLTLGAGQFCTNPGIIVLAPGKASQKFETAAVEAAGQVAAQTMLTDGICSAFHDGVERMAAQSGVEALMKPERGARQATPALFRTTAGIFLGNELLADEIFGPVGILVQCENQDQIEKIADSMHGQLTCTLHLDSEDLDVARQLLPVLETKAGRLLANGYPTGVEVADAMVHGGPYPASTNFGATSVGTLSIRRFLRPVCYQNFPDELLVAVSAYADL